MFYADIRACPKISLNVNLILEMLQDAFPDQEVTDSFAEMITRNLERSIAISLNQNKTVRVVDHFLEVIENIVPPQIARRNF